MLHPEARFLLDLMAQRGIAPTHTLPPDQARQMYVERRTVTQPEPPEVASVQDISAHGPAGAIALRHYRPAGTAAGQVLPVLVYYHGGGWVIGDLDTHDVLCRQLANASGCAVIAVNYRLAPEAVFPAAVDDCLAATRWVHANAAALHIDPERIAVGGDSAGGNLAAVVALAARDAAESGAGALPVRFQLLIYPAVDMRQLTPSITANGKGYLLEQATMAYFQGHYTGNNAAVHDEWRASPLLAASHKNLPPALVLTAGFDPLRDEGHLYADCLAQAGVKTSYVCFERQIHGFITMGKVFTEANAAVRLCAAELRAALAS